MTGMVRAPRAVLAVSGGNIIPIEVTVEMTTLRKSDKFSARISLDSSPGLDEVYWSALTDNSITVNATNDINQGGLSPLFLGHVDTVDIDWQNRTAHISGRDLGAALLETKTTEEFLNQTTAQIVTAIAGRVGLTANVSVPNSDMVGLVYKTEYSRITDSDVLMNVLSRLAQRAGCVFYISGKTLNFLPASQLNGNVFTVSYQRPTQSDFATGNFITLSTHRNYVLGKNLKVRTRSYQLKQKKVVDSQYNMPGTVTGDLVHEYRAPNMTKQQADIFTQNRLNEISSREKTLEISMPGDISVGPNTPIALVGTGTAFDQTYVISRVSHSFSQSNGYRMTISTRNKDKARKAAQATAGTDETTP